MSKLSLFKPGKSKDYRFFDNIIGQSFDISGTLIHCHKYIGPNSNSIDSTSSLGPTGTLSETSIQDVMLMENRDRKYDETVIDLKGAYTVNDLDFNLSVFGIMQNAGTLFINFHINQLIDRLGRKLIPGDVLEIVHRRDEVNLDPTVPFIPAYYVVKDAAKAAEGYSPTWLPHIWRTKVEPITDSQEFSQILKTKVSKGKTLEDLISTFKQNDLINQTIQDEAMVQVPSRYFNSDHLYIEEAGSTLKTNNLLEWPFNNDGTPPNMNTKAPSGRRWPENPTVGDYFIRSDYSPPRLFKRETNKWVFIQDIYRDRPWVPAHRMLEDHLEDQTITKLTTKPEDQFLERQPVSNPIPPKDDLPKG